MDRQISYPEDASGEYLSYEGRTWIKGLDVTKPHWPLAYVWSKTTKRWRKKRQVVDIKRITLFE
jgi:hypothetical protein